MKLRALRLPRALRGVLGVLVVAPVAFVLAVPAYTWLVVYPSRLPAADADAGEVSGSPPPPLVPTSLGAPFVFGRVVVTCATSAGGRPGPVAGALVGDPHVTLAIPGAISGATAALRVELPSPDLFVDGPPEDVDDRTSLAGIPGVAADANAKCVGPATVRVRAVRVGDPLVVERQGAGARPGADAVAKRVWFGRRAALEARYATSLPRRIAAGAFLLAAVTVLAGAALVASRRRPAAGAS